MKIPKLLKWLPIQSGIHKNSTTKVVFLMLNVQVIFSRVNPTFLKFEFCSHGYFSHFDNNFGIFFYIVDSIVCILFEKLKK